MTEKRRKRKINLYMRIWKIINNADLTYKAATLIADAIDENITTTQMNQINISLNVKFEKYLRGEECL